MLHLRILSLGLALTASSWAWTSAWAAQLAFEKTPYGLLFADIIVNDQPLRAMLDFGDPYSLQLATSFLDDQGIPVESRSLAWRSRIWSSAPHPARSTPSLSR